MDYLIENKINNLENHGMIDMMHHHWTRHQSVNRFAINAHALWQKWIRQS